jgi:hypothetical protein
MQSDNKHDTPVPEDAHGDGEFGPPAEPGDELGASRRLTHAERVERVNAYLRRAAAKGIWTAIE